MRFGAPGWLRRALGVGSPRPASAARAARRWPAPVVLPADVPPLGRMLGDHLAGRRRSFDLPTRRALALKVKTASALVDEAARNGTPLATLAADRLVRERAALERDWTRILDTHCPLETLTRTLSWAGGRTPWRMPVELLDLGGRDAAEIDRVLARCHHTNGAPLFWWSSMSPLPPAVAAACRRHGLALLSSSPDPAPHADSGPWTDVNPAIVECPRPGGAPLSITLPGSAAWIQALLCSDLDEGWVRVTPPTGLRRLAEDVKLSRLREILDTGQVAVVWSRGPGSDLVLPQKTIQKMATPDRCPDVSATSPSHRKERVMPNDEPKGIPRIIYPESDFKADKMSLSHMVWLFDTRPGESPRSADELGETAAVTASSLEEVCAGLGLVIETTVEDIDGKLVPVTIPVTGDGTFSPNGLTGGCMPLFDRYQRLRALEEMQGMLDRDGTPLTAEEIDAARRIMDQLEDHVVPTEDDQPEEN